MGFITSFLKGILYLTAGVIGIAALVAGKNSWDGLRYRGSAEAVAVAKAQTAPPKAPTPADLWGYSDNEGALGYRSRQAQIDSVTMLNFAFPYDGPQPLTMTLRNHSKHGKDVIFAIKQGQFLCDSTDCSVEVRFDDGKPMIFEGAETADRSTTAMFLKGYDRFYSRMVKAKRIVVAPTFFREGSPAVEFDVSGFNAEAFSGTVTAKKK